MGKVEKRCRNRRLAGAPHKNQAEMEVAYQVGGRSKEQVTGPDVDSEANPMAVPGVEGLYIGQERGLGIDLEVADLRRGLEVAGLETELGMEHLQKAEVGRTEAGEHRSALDNREVPDAGHRMEAARKAQVEEQVDKVPDTAVQAGAREADMQREGREALAEEEHHRDSHSSWPGDRELLVLGVHSE